MIYSYNKTNEMHQSLKFILHVLDSFCVHHQECSTVHTAIGICHSDYADCLLASSQHNLGIELYVFRTVSLSIIRSLVLCVQY